ncbi:MAG: branched-chain amino acid ABC transporter permease [Alphaproteobacteria bacterium]|nr:branched-chain amino acid ABC transporter permease [Alphaproteobacteria bacterium]
MRRVETIYGPLAVLALLIGFAFIADNYFLRLSTSLLMYVVLALSWNFIGGLAGYPSFATAAFFGLGAYCGAILQKAGVPMFVAWAAAGLLSGVFAMALGRAILHLKGHYFAIASLIVAEALREVVNTWTGLTGGGMGLNLPILRLDVTVQARFFFFSMLTIAAASFVLSAFVIRSKLGFGLSCIRQNEDAANILGVDATTYKISAFTLSAVLVGPAGAIYATWVNYIEPGDVFEILHSVKPIVMVILGGAGTLYGPIVGAFAFIVLEEVVWRNVLTFHSGLLGLLIVLLVLFMPQGLMRVTARRLLRRKTRP